MAHATQYDYRSATGDPPSSPKKVLGLPRFQVHHLVHPLPSLLFIRSNLLGFVLSPLFPTHISLFSRARFSNC
uniref:Uncharacterized protein n=1 Tax=Oryza punctata TaxID=4537 RepID=A0A0E0M0E3_ORYPU